MQITKDTRVSAILEEYGDLADVMEVFGVRCRFVTLPMLIQLKRAAGRPKDLESLAELEALQEERRRQ